MALGHNDPSQTFGHLMRFRCPSNWLGWLWTCFSWWQNHMLPIVTHCCNTYCCNKQRPAAERCRASRLCGAIMRLEHTMHRTICVAECATRAKLRPLPWKWWSVLPIQVFHRPKPWVVISCLGETAWLTRAVRCSLLEFSVFVTGFTCFFTFPLLFVQPSVAVPVLLRFHLDLGCYLSYVSLSFCRFCHHASL